MGAFNRVLAFLGTVVSPFAGAFRLVNRNRRWCSFDALLGSCLERPLRISKEAR
jgi:hypothetical protein